MASATKRILVIEDNPDVRDFVGAIFKDSIYFIEYAEDGVKGLAAMRKRRPDLVLLDIRMPLLDGFQTLEVIRRDPTLRHIPVIMLTAGRAEKDVRRALEMGAAGYIAKPMGSSALFERVGHVLGVAHKDSAPASPHQI